MMKRLPLTKLIVSNCAMGQMVVGIIALVLLFYSQAVQSQTSEYYKIKKVKPADFNVSSDIIDEYNHAVYIYNIGECNVEFFSGNNPDIRFQIKQRIKILKDEGLSHADVAIPLHVGMDDAEQIISVKGGVYNLVNGKVEFEKLKNGDWFVEERSADREVVRIAFKNARVGSIIELEYTIANPFIFRPRDWDFQLNDAPVLYSEYTFSSPQMMGYGLFRRDWLGVIKEPIIRDNVLGVSPGVGRPNFYKTEYTFIAENVPSMRREPFMNSSDNYRASIITELKFVAFDAADKKYFFKDWQSSAEEFSDNWNNADFLTPSENLNYYKSPLSSDTAEVSNSNEIVKDVYSYISTHYSESDETNYLSATRTPRTLLSSSKLSKNEINWLLVATLKLNGIEAYPVLYCERNQALIRTDVPIFSQFDDVMAAVEIDGTYILLDASNPALPFGEIAEWSYNGDGLLLNEDNLQWLEMRGRYETAQKCDIEFDRFEDGILKGQMNVTLSGIYANRMIRFLLRNDIDDINESFNLYENTQLKLLEETDLNQMQPLVLKFEISVPTNKFGDSYLVYPVMFDPQTENPFIESERKYPVNFPSVWSKSYTCLIRLDQEKYEAFVPEPSKYVLPNNDGSFAFHSNYTFGNLLIRSKIEMNKTTFGVGEYKALRELYNLVSTSHLSNIEIKEK